MTNITLASCLAYPDLSASNQRLADALHEVGAHVVVRPWNAQDQSAFESADLVLIRQTWDYMDDPGGFASWAAWLARTGVNVKNAPNLAVWNNDKRTLPELTRIGLSTPVTSWARDDDLERIADLPSDSIVLKPAFGGGGVGVEIANKSNYKDVLHALRLQHPGRAWLAQEYLPEIANGEWKLTCFGGHAEIAVHLVPKAGEFRVNNRFDPTIGVGPIPPSAARAAETVSAWLGSEAVVFRLDGVIRDDAFVCTELELTDPDLFLHLGREETVARLAQMVLSHA